MGVDVLPETDEKNRPTFSWSNLGVHSEVGIPKAHEVDFLPLDDEASKNHERAMEIYGQLSDRNENQLAIDVLNAYREAMENVDLRSTVKVLETTKGAEVIAQVARLNLVKQVDLLLIAAGELILDDEKVVRAKFFGGTRNFENSGEIERELLKIAVETMSLKNDIEHWASEDEEERQSVNKMRDVILARLEKYMFDGRNAEKRIGQPQSLMIMGESSGALLETELRDKGVIADSNEILSVRDLPNGLTKEEVANKFREIATGDPYKDNILATEEGIPGTVVINITPENLQLIDEKILALDYLYIDRLKLPPEERPNIIVYTNGLELSGEIKGYLSGFLFCKTADELHETIELTKGLVRNRQKESLYKQDELEVGQRKSYNNSELREWENVTASTYESLKRLIGRINSRNEWFRAKYTSLFAGSAWFKGNRHDIAPAREIKTVLDLGTGEGRISQMLARIGLNVLGVDLSAEQLKKAKERIKDEGRFLRGEDRRVGSSAEALLEVKKEMHDVKIDFSDKRARKRFLTAEGSFFKVKEIVRDAIGNWQKKFPNIDQDSFFNNEEKSFDMAMFNWHTFCEVGSLANQQDVLEQIFSVLTPGGELVLEIPDRLFEPYASALAAYHEAHPDEPYGTIRDKKPDGFDGDSDDVSKDNLYPPRYFPDINELVLLLKSIGFETNQDDIQTYLIQHEGKMTLKEHFITARRPKK